MKRSFLFSTLLATTTFGMTAVQAAEPAEAVQGFIDEHVMTWVQAPVLIDAINARNLETAGFDEAQVLALDTAWRAEVGLGNAPTIDPILFNEASDYLRVQVGQTAGMVTEIFVMDAVGLNVATSDTTSDFWQGDEAKWQQTYAVGADAVHFSEIEFDESSQSYQMQVSVTITDPNSGAPIGAMTVGINADSLM